MPPFHFPATPGGSNPQQGLHHFPSIKKLPQNWNREPNPIPSGKHTQEGLGLCSMSTGGCSHTAGWQFLGTKKVGLLQLGLLLLDICPALKGSYPKSTLVQCGFWRENLSNSISKAFPGSGSCRGVALWERDVKQLPALHSPGIRPSIPSVTKAPAKTCAGKSPQIKD